MFGWKPQLPGAVVLTSDDVARIADATLGATPWI
jgi:hypothetical protein